MKSKMRLALTLLLIGSLVGFSIPAYAYNLVGTWSSATVVKNDSAHNVEYGRMLKLSNGNWLSVYSVYLTNVQLEIARSTDNGRTWTPIGSISDPGRDVDNGMLAQLPNGDVLVGSRSVIWGTSYQLKVYKSTDLGATWSYLSTIDQNNGSPGSLSNPDKGMYEPHFYFLDNGNLAVMYANEKHVTENPSYSQIISQRVSTDYGVTWGNEIWVAWDPNNAAARPGMPVWTKMNNGQYMVVFEVCGTDNCNIHYKTSMDGTTWSSGIGRTIPGQYSAPFLLSLPDGQLAVTSNSGNLSFSDDYGTSWYLNGPAPWTPFGKAWSSLYMTGPNEIAAMTSVDQGNYRSNVQLKFGTFVSKGYVKNAGFEENTGQTPNGWNVSGPNPSANFVETSGVPGGSQNGAYHNAMWSATPYEAYVCQTVDHLSNGSYNVSAWTESTGGLAISQMEIGNYGSSVNVPIPTGTSSYQQINSGHINVTTGSVNICFHAKSTRGNQWIRIDDVSLQKNQGFESNDISGWYVAGANPDFNFPESYGGSHSGSYHGAMWSASPFETWIYKDFDHVPNGAHTITAWTESTGGLAINRMEVSEYGGAVNVSVPTGTSSYQQISSGTINVTTGKVRVAFHVKSTTGNQWTRIDDVSLN
ncbi:sialidase family protein [Cohnella hashimotonis]|uniref:Sialidase family protein n=1 Tax=Cohnella hashimotonis TaxID=2826895 RepID=A0ABT6TGJ8_9BACL|nr:sialidase family protein [Cohnella hashimotonis]MDI4645054.1 sialidase family protein [Cohnella hashimotonis]